MSTSYYDEVKDFLKSGHYSAVYKSNGGAFISMGGTGPSPITWFGPMPEEHMEGYMTVTDSDGSKHGFPVKLFLYGWHMGKNGKEDGPHIYFWRDPKWPRSSPTPETDTPTTPLRGGVND